MSSFTPQIIPEDTKQAVIELVESADKNCFGEFTILLQLHKKQT